MERRFESVCHFVLDTECDPEALRFSSLSDATQTLIKRKVDWFRVRSSKDRQIALLPVCVN